MSTQLILAIATITLALVFYTIGVFSERRAGTLKGKHAFLFFLGLVFDTTGTTIMSNIAKSNSDVVQSGLQLHQITGMAALLLMLGHLIWAMFVLWKGSDKAKLSFHKFSIVVWAFWLIPYIAGLIIGMSH